MDNKQNKSARIDHHFFLSVSVFNRISMKKIVLKHLLYVDL